VSQVDLLCSWQPQFFCADGEQLDQASEAILSNLRIINTDCSDNLMMVLVIRFSVMYAVLRRVACVSTHALSDGTNHGLFATDGM